MVEAIAERRATALEDRAISACVSIVLITYIEMFEAIAEQKKYVATGNKSKWHKQKQAKY